MNQASRRCVLASGNQKKIEELRIILAEFGIDATPQSRWHIRDAEETGSTFVENALIKARHAAAICTTAALADDSGLCVPTLHGAPGVYSARYAGVDADDLANNAKLLEQLGDHTDRRAYFVCVIVYLRHAHDPLPLIAQGVWHGEIASAPRGESGFGYDPLFYLPDRGCTAAQLTTQEKNRISHRAIALHQLQKQLHGNALFS